VLCVGMLCACSSCYCAGNLCSICIVFLLMFCPLFKICQRLACHSDAVVSHTPLATMLPAAEEEKARAHLIRARVWHAPIDGSAVSSNLPSAAVPAVATRLHAPIISPCDIMSSMLMLA
jgi:hypothetical protein